MITYGLLAVAAALDGSLLIESSMPHGCAAILGFVDSQV
jgi:hypothetical protein